MIHVTRLDGTAAVLNVDLIERIESTPDTMIRLANGESLLVRETPDVLVRRTIAFKHAVVAGRPEVIPFAHAVEAGS
ncbi:MAG: flagellar FlbD family protein [Vicinamibacterales bacterium]|nr:flagellar FlbD family protein [Vicinamibacterales bacterium]